MMLRPDMRAMLFPAFAVFDARGPVHTSEMHGRWVGKLAVQEYADELVFCVLCVNRWCKSLPFRIPPLRF